MASGHFRGGSCLLIAVLTIGVLGGCSLIKKAEEVPPPESSVLPEEVAPESPEVHFDRAIELLKQGKPEEADAELHNYLDLVPKSKQAKFLVGQIETPVAKLFPAKNFRVRMAKGGNLSSVAKTYLGNSLAFYGLARYNDIAVPANVHDGQWLRIPKTPVALAARRAATAPPATQQSAAQQSTARKTSMQAAEKPEPALDEKLARLPSKDQHDAPASIGKPPSRALAQRFYRAGLIAFQRQDLDGAIAAWHRALAADPGFTDAQIRLLEAERLKQKLQTLRK